MNPESENCKKIVTEIENHFVTTDSDINNIYKECKKHIGPEKYKCIDLVGIYSFINHNNTKEDMHADPGIQWEFCNFDIL